MAKVRWRAEQLIGKLRVYARASRSKIIVRIENDGDTTKYAEMGYPKLFDLGLAMKRAALETRPEDIRESTI